MDRLRVWCSRSILQRANLKVCKCEAIRLLECDDKIVQGPQFFSEPDLVGNILALTLQHSGQIRSSSSGFK